jgi:HK97 family phage portal protein
MAYLLRLDKNELKTVTFKHPEDYDTVTSGGQIRDLYSRVPWLYRAVTIRAQTLSRVPFSVMKGDTEIDSSDNYQNKSGLIADPSNLFYLIEAALCLFGRAYLLPQKNEFGYSRGLRWFLPTTIEPVVSDIDGITGWRRSVGSGTRSYAREELIYIWQPNPFSETEPGEPPAKAALAAAGVLRNVDKFATTFFERGAIKATILTVDGGASKEQLDSLKTWWNRAVTGLRNAWGSNVFNAAVKPVVIGDGIKELENSTLTTEKREDIATALGIPQSLLFSNAANYATAQQDDRGFYDKTIIPDCLIIQQSINGQYLQESGYSLKFRPEALGVNKEDEASRAAAFAAYVSGGMPPSISAEILGITLPAGVEYTDLDGKPEPPPEPQAQSQTTPQTAATVEDVQPIDEELKNFKRKAVNALKAGKSPAVDFISDVLPGDMIAAIRGQLTECKTADDVRRVFEAKNFTKQVDFSDLVETLRAAIRG